MGDVRRCWKVPVVWCGRDGRMHEDWVCRDGTREEALASVAHTMTADPGVAWWAFNFKRKEA